jgi:ubiquinone biosynthesis protein Coq4
MAMTTIDGVYLSQFLQLTDYVSDWLGLSVPPIVQIEQLRQLTPGTLGRAVANSLDQAGLAPFTTGPRRKQLHDSVHVLTGYGTDPVGEAEVQAFLLGAKFNPVQLALGLGLLRMIRRRSPLPVPQLRERLWQAYQRGQASTFDVDTWQPETQWSKPLAEVQASLQIQAIAPASRTLDQRKHRCR